MKNLKDFINESLFDTIKNVFNKKAKNDNIEISDKKMSMEELLKYINDNLKKEDKKDAAQLVSDITEIIKKDADSFKKIIPILNKWTQLNDKNKKYSFDTFIGNKECTTYIQNLIDNLSSNYGWKSFRNIEVEDIEDYMKDNEESGSKEYFIYNTAFIAYVLAIIINEIK